LAGSRWRRTAFYSANASSLPKAFPLYTNRSSASRLAVICKARSRSNGRFHYKRAQRRQMTGERLARRESFHAGHTGVAAFANGTTIACAPRLGLARMEGF